MKNHEFHYSIFSKYRSLLMGGAIVLILFCHLDISQEKNGLPISHLAIICHMFTVGVDIFMFLSGFGLYYSFSPKKPTYFSYLKRRIIKLLPKYLLTAGITGVIVTLLFNKLGFIRFIEDLTFISWFKYENTRYWFIAGILVFYAFFPILYKILYSERGEYKLLLFVILYLVATVVLDFCFPSIYKNIRIAIERFPIFCFGVLCGKKSKENRYTSNSYAIIFASIGFAVTIFQYIIKPYGSFVSNTHFAYYLCRGLFAIAIMITICLFLEALHLWSDKLYGFIIVVFSYIGGITLEIYLLHQSFLILLGYPGVLYKYFFAAVVLPISTAIIWQKISLIINKKVVTK